MAQWRPEFQPSGNTGNELRKSEVGGPGLYSKNTKLGRVITKRKLTTQSKPLPKASFKKVSIIIHMYLPLGIIFPFYVKLSETDGS